MDNTEIKILELPKILDRRGNLSFVEQLKHIPFEIKRSYWIYDVPGGAERGGHAYRKNDEFMIALSGSFDVVLNDGKEEKIVRSSPKYEPRFKSLLLWVVCPPDDLAVYAELFNQLIGFGCFFY